MEYQAAVAEARTLVARSQADQWRLAELCYAVMYKDIKTDDWAADVGVSTTYVSRLYRMWEALPEDVVRNRNFPPFPDAYKEVSPASAYRPPLDRQPAEDQAAAIQEALKDPQVAERVFTDSGSKARAMNAIQRDDRLKGFGQPGPAPYPHLDDNPNDATLGDQARRTLDDRADIMLAIGALQRVLGRGADLGDGRVAVESDLDRLSRYVKAAMQLVVTGRSLDEEFAEMLGGQS